MYSTGGLVPAAQRCGLTGAQSPLVTDSMRPSRRGTAKLRDTRSARTPSSAATCSVVTTRSPRSIRKSARPAGLTTRAVPMTHTIPGCLIHKTLKMQP